MSEGKKCTEKKEGVLQLAMLAVIVGMAVYYGEGSLSAGVAVVDTLFTQNAAILVLALGMLFPILTVGLDLSGSYICSACIMVYALVSQYSELAVVLTLLTGVMLGSMNGWLVKKLKLPASVVTFVSGQIIYAVCSKFYLESNFIKVNQDSISYRCLHLLFSVKIAGISLSLIVVILLLAAESFILKRTYLGRCMWAIKSDKESADRLGVPVELTQFAALAISGLFAAAAALLSIGRLGYGQGGGSINSTIYAFVIVLLTPQIMNGKSYNVGSFLISAIFICAVRIIILQLFRSASTPLLILPGILLIVVSLLGKRELKKIVL